MTKNLLLYLISYSVILPVAAQLTSGLDIVLNAVVIDNNSQLPEESKDRLHSKLVQIAAANGVASQGLNPRFVVAVKTNTLSKNIIPGPPQMVAMNLEFTFYIGDAVSGQVFSTFSMEQKGVGNNENKAFLNAIQKLTANNSNFTAMIGKGKEKIHSYYDQNCGSILSEANTLAAVQKYDEAIYNLLLIPESVSSCAVKVLPLIQELQQIKIDFTSKKLFRQAEALWAANPTRSGADEVSAILKRISPLYSGFNEVKEFVVKIGNKIESIEKKEWDFKLLEFDSNVKLEQQRIEAARAAAIEYHRSSPQVIIYNKVYWW